MSTAAVGLSAGSLILVFGVWLRYLAAIPKNKVSARPIGPVVLQLGGIGLAVVSVVLSFSGGGSPGLGVILPGAFSLLLASFFLWLLTQRKTPLGRIQVKVGDALLPFDAKTSEGAPFHSDALSGQRTLLKFFRGGW